MQKVVVVAVSFGCLAFLATAQSAFAERDCEAEYHECTGTNRVSSKRAAVCQVRANKCYNTKPQNQVHNGPFQPGRSVDKDRSSGSKGDNGTGGGGGGSRPKPGAHRTVDGGIVMVTPEGKEWIWNGKYNAVMTTNTGYPVQINVKQGDPDVMLKKWADGRQYNVADPAYSAAVARDEAKKAAAAAAQKATAQATAKQQSQDYLSGTRGGSGKPGSSKPNAQGSTTPVQANNILQTGVKPRKEK